MDEIRESPLETVIDRVDVSRDGARVFRSGKIEKILHNTIESINFPHENISKFMPLVFRREPCLYGVERHQRGKIERAA